MFFPTGIFNEKKYIWMPVVPWCAKLLFHVSVPVLHGNPFSFKIREGSWEWKAPLSGIVLKDWSLINYLSSHTEIWVAYLVGEGWKDPSAVLIPRLSILVFQNIWEQWHLVFLWDTVPKWKGKRAWTYFILIKAVQSFCSSGFLLPPCPFHVWLSPSVIRCQRLWLKRFPHRQLNNWGLRVQFFQEFGVIANVSQMLPFLAKKKYWMLLFQKLKV